MDVEGRVCGWDRHRGRNARRPWGRSPARLTQTGPVPVSNKRAFSSLGGNRSFRKRAGRAGTLPNHRCTAPPRRPERSAKSRTKIRLACPESAVRALRTTRIGMPTTPPTTRVSQC
ncbi:hypothetical protein KPATCC21470_3230 [Kitasatospora purpeofusca]